MTGEDRAPLDALFGHDPETGAIDGLEQVARRYAEVLATHNPRHAETIHRHAAEMLAELRFTVTQERRIRRLYIPETAERALVAAGRQTGKQNLAKHTLKHQIKEESTDD